MLATARVSQYWIEKNERGKYVEVRELEKQLDQQSWLQEPK